MVHFWGPRYRDYFVDLCLPALLAPENLPLLRAADDHRFLIATTAADWAAIQRLPIMEKLRSYATPTWLEIADPGQETGAGTTNAILYQNVCQRMLVERAFADRAFGILLWPDVLVSAGTVASLRKHAQSGTQLVLCAALRQTMESVLAELANTGILPPGSRPSVTGQPIVLMPRALASIAVRHLHAEVSIYEHGTPDTPYVSPFKFWRIPGQDGIILRSFFAVPLLMDFGALEQHDTACLDNDIFENTYVRRNFYRDGGMHVVQDSDEIAIVSLTPAAVCQTSTPHPVFRMLAKYDPSGGVRASMGTYARRDPDPLKRDIFRHSIRWHAGELDATWEVENRQISALVDRMAGDYFAIADKKGLHAFPSRLTLDPRCWPAEMLLLWLENAALRALIRPFVRLVRKGLQIVLRRRPKGQPARHFGGQTKPTSQPGGQQSQRQYFKGSVAPS